MTNSVTKRCAWLHTLLGERRVRNNEHQSDARTQRAREFVILPPQVGKRLRDEVAPKQKRFDLARATKATTAPSSSKGFGGGGTSNNGFGGGGGGGGGGSPRSGDEGGGGLYDADFDEAAAVAFDLDVRPRIP